MLAYLDGEPAAQEVRQILSQARRRRDRIKDMDSKKSTPQRPMDPIVEMILAGKAQSASEAEELYLDGHLAEVVALVEGPLSDREFREHPLISLLFAHGSRGFEDSLT